MPPLSTIPKSPAASCPVFAPVTRADAYRTDILHSTNNEFGFDYLRDNLADNKKKSSTECQNQ